MTDSSSDNSQSGTDSIPSRAGSLPNRAPSLIAGATVQRSALIGFLALSVVILGMIAMALEAPEIRPEGAQQAAVVAAANSFLDVSILADAAIVIDIQTGSTLYEKNADTQLPIASLTKVALALAVSEALPSDSVVTIPYDAEGGVSIERLRAGGEWRMRDIIDFTLVESSNTGADILAGIANDAIHTRFPESPAQEATLWRMNALVQDLGMMHTYFLNVNGLDLSTTQAGAYGSARDIATLFAYAAAADPALFAGTARATLSLISANGKESAAAANTNTSQGAIPGLILGKTGITDLAGGNLAVVFDVGFARPVVAVVLHSTRDGRFEDIQMLVTRAHRAIAHN